MANQAEMKMQAALKAIEYVPEGAYIGVGTGSTVNCFIEALGEIKDRILGAVSTSAESTRRLEALGIKVVELNEAGRLPIYVDGADEINHSLQMIKGGGAALLPEKIVAHAADKFICIADESKYVSRLGKFPLPVEVVPFARSYVAKMMIKLGGRPEWRIGVETMGKHDILDLHDFMIDEPLAMERAINAIPGVMENGLFADRPADILLLACKDGVKVIEAK